MFDNKFVFISFVFMSQVGIGLKVVDQLRLKLRSGTAMDLTCELN